MDYCGDNSTPASKGHPDPSAPANGGGSSGGSGSGSSGTGSSSGKAGCASTGDCVVAPPKPTLSFNPGSAIGPIDLTHLAWGSGDWSRLTDWCALGGAQVAPAVCQYAAAIAEPVTSQLRANAATLAPDGLQAGFLAFGLIVTEGADEPEAQEAIDKLESDLAAIGDGSGPWAPSLVNPGGAVAQATEGSCVSACGEMLSGGDLSQTELIDRLGAPTDPLRLGPELGADQTARYFFTADEAADAAQRGPIGAVLQAPGQIGHMVVIEPVEAGSYFVRDPFGGGSTYTVSEAWIRQWVSAAVFR